MKKNKLKNQRYRHFTITIPETGFDDRDGNNFNLEVFLARCDADNVVYILHDKDKRENGDLVNPHYQAYFYYKDNKTMSAVARKLKLAISSFQYVYSSASQMANYLLHWGSNQPVNKYRYAIEDLQQDYKELPLDLLALVGDVSNSSKYSAKRVFIDEIMPKIKGGEIDRHNYRSAVKDKPYEFDGSLDDMILKAFDLIDKELESLVQEEPIQLTLFYFYGAERSLKSSIARKLCGFFGSFTTIRNLSVWDNYGGQKSVVVQETNFADFKPESLLDLLDTNVGVLPARYKDKSKVHLRNVVMTSNKTFGEQMKEMRAKYDAMNDKQQNAFFERIFMIVKFFDGFSETDKPVIEHLNLTINNVEINKDDFQEMLNTMWGDFRDKYGLADDRDGDNRQEMAFEGY